jgi:hypothetical protein
MDPENAVVKLCAAGMEAEGRGESGEARRLFAEAWETARDDFEACIAAHYLARHQASAQEALQWNETALRLAEAVGDERVEGFYGSLLLNVGRSHEELGNVAFARQYYTQAAERASTLADDGYGAMVRRGAEAGQRRVGDSDA